EVDVRQDTYIKQIKTPQTLVNVNTLSSTSYQLEFYLASDIVGWNTNGAGTYVLTNTATAFVTWHVDSPDGNLNRWCLQEIRNGTARTNLLEYDSTNQV